MTSSTFLYGRLLRMALGCGIFLCMSSASAQTFAPYSAFEAMSLTDLETLQVKITYVGGIQNAVHRSVVFTSDVNSVDLSVFEPFQRPNVLYDNDVMGIDSFTIAVEDLKAVITNVGTLSNVVAGGVGPIPFVAFTLYNTQPSVTVFDATLEKTDAVDLFEKLRLALANSTAGLRTLGRFACGLELQGTTVPTEVSDDISVTLTGTRLNRATGRFVAKATITNPATTLLPPVSLVFGMSYPVRLAEDHGFTCNISPVGAQYINLDVTPGPGETTEVAVEFINPNKETIAPSIRVFSGPGSR